MKKVQKVSYIINTVRPNDEYEELQDIGYLQKEVLELSEDPLFYAVVPRSMKVAIGDTVTILVEGD